MPFIWTFKHANVCSHVHSCKSVHVSSADCRMRPLQVAVFLCTLLYSSVWSTVEQYLYFKSRMSKSKHKSSGNAAGAAKKHQVIMMETKVKIIESGARQKNGTGGPEKEQRQTRRTSWGNFRCRKWQGRRIHRSCSSSSDATQCCHVIIYDEKTRAATQASLGLFSRK